MATVTRYFCLHLEKNYRLLFCFRDTFARHDIKTFGLFQYTLFLYIRMLFFPAQAEYSYFSAEFRLKIFLYYSQIIAYDISILEFIGYQLYQS